MRATCAQSSCTRVTGVFFRLPHHIAYSLRLTRAGGLTADGGGSSLVSAVGFRELKGQ